MPTIINYDILEDTFWSFAEGPYYICLVDQLYAPAVNPGATLTIESGAIVYLDSGFLEEYEAPLSPSLIINGTLNASGTTFTSYFPEHYWGNIIFRPGSHSNIFGCTFEFGGSGESVQGILSTETSNIQIPESNSTDLLITESTFKYGMSNGIYFAPNIPGSLSIISVTFEQLAGGINAVNNFNSQATINLSECRIQSCQNHGLVINGFPASITNCTMTNNSGAGLELLNSNFKIDRCDITANHYLGLHVSNSSIGATNCLIAKNQSTGVLVNSTVITMENCTIADNTGSMFFPGGIICNSSKFTAQNCIAYGNTDGNISNNGSNITVNYSLIGGTGVYPGDHNINIDPLFADPANGNYHLKSVVGRWNRETDTWVTDNVSSPCIDAGNPASQYLNEPQPNGGRMNMGFEGNTVYASKASAAPKYLGVEMSNKRTCYLRFNEEIHNNTPDLAALKAGVRFAADGENFQSLQSGDSVSIRQSMMIIIFLREMGFNLNKIELASEILKNKFGIVLDIPVMTEQIAIQNPEAVYALRRVIPTTASVRRVEVIRGEFAVFRSDRAVMFSRNGIDWDTLSPAPVEMRSVAYGGGTYAAVGDLGFIYASTDRRNWDRVPPVTSRPLNSVTYRDGMFAAVGDNGTVLTSASGTSWAQVQAPPVPTLNKVAAAPSGFIAVGDSGTILSSANGAEWIQEPPLTAQRLNDIAVGPDATVIVGDQGTVLTAARGKALRKEAPPTASDLRAVAYGNGKFVTAGSIFTSSDGLSWTEAVSPVSEQLYGAAFNNNTFLLGGAGGVLLQSGPLFLLPELTRGVPFV